MCGKAIGSCDCPDAIGEEFFQNIVVSDVEMSTATSAQMTTAALRHLRAGKGFMRAGHSSELSRSVPVRK
jgi:hypothetical protein